MTMKHTLRHATATLQSLRSWRVVPVIALLAALPLGACGAGAGGGEPSGAGASGATGATGATESNGAQGGDQAAQPASGSSGGSSSGTSASSSANGNGESTGAQPASLQTTDRGRTFLDEVQREARSLDPLTSYYSHTTVMNESTNTRQTDCSGFVDYALGRVLPAALDGVGNDAAKGRPLADDWYRFLAARPAAATTNPSQLWWRRVMHPINLVPGDVVAWLRPANVNNTNTGHIMVVTGAPRVGRDHEIILPITDATESPHANDSRTNGHTGIGSGEVGIQIDAQGEAIGYWWKGGESPTSYQTSIAFGHIE
jgi:hypothetical protein